MKAVGIVAEYNPFHGGHQYQIRKIRESCGADTPVVAVMSGDFVQRGEAASYDKFTRAEAAVRGGVSLVIELPLPWSLSSAEGFARGGVGLLGATGVVGTLSFGSESGNLSAIEKTAAVLDTPEYNEALKAMLAGGTPFAAARAGAARALLGNTAAVLNTPNDLLAVEYLRASAKLGHTFKYIPVRREGSVHDGAGSASELRALLREMKTRAALPVITKSARIRDENETARHVFDLGSRAHDLLVLGWQNRAAQAADSDYRATPYASVHDNQERV